MRRFFDFGSFSLGSTSLILKGHSARDSSASLRERFFGDDAIAKGGACRGATPAGSARVAVQPESPKRMAALGRGGLVDGVPGGEDRGAADGLRAGR